MSDLLNKPTLKELHMTAKQIWLITSAGRGLGLDITKAALAAGHIVVATGRDPEKVAAAVGDDANLMTVKLDVTSPEDAQTAIEAAIKRFGRIDVLVNDAGNFYAGFFEELSSEQVRDQLDTLLLGSMNVTRAALPIMRKQRAGLLVTISSTAGITGGMFCTAYAAAKFGLEGWTESLIPEIEPFGIRSMLVEPGFFRTELLTTDSTVFAKPSIPDYAERTKETVAAWSAMNGKQAVTPPSSQLRLCNSRRSRSPRHASPPAPTLCRPSRRRPVRSLHKPTPTASCRALWPTTKREQVRAPQTDQRIEI